MTKPLGAFDESQGTPSLSALKDLGQNMSGGRLRSIASAIAIDIAADATGGLTFPVPFTCRVFDVIVESSRSSGSGTVTLKNGSDSVTNAIAMETDKAITRAGTIDHLYSHFEEGDNFTLTTNGAADKGWVKLIVLPEAAV